MKTLFHQYLAICFLLCTVACTGNRSALPTADTDTSDKKYRPLFHFTPPANWMNDPNGMVFYNGEYHLFYQYHPYGNTWGPMHWGHATSTNLVQWTHLPVALKPDSLGYIFSGSAVVDWHNSSKLGNGNQPPLVALFTYHSMEAEKAGKVRFQHQGLAFSNDSGRTWEKYKDNPVLNNPGIKDFRDPKVIWHEASKRWVMVLAVKDKVAFYTSENLKEWTFSSDFNPEWAAYGGVWECPDLFAIKTQEGHEKWVLLVSINPGAPQGGSGTQYFVGHFNGKRFVSETSSVKWLDYGTDNYAGVTWSDIPSTDGRRLFIGWMSNWQYAQQVPTTTWRSAMTLPRELQLFEHHKDLTLYAKPVRELAMLRKKRLDLKGNQFELPNDGMEIALQAQHNAFELLFSNEKQDAVLFYKKADTLIFDRSKSGIIAFNDSFPKLQRTVLPNGFSVKNLKVFLDRSSMEIFINDGEMVLTALIFPRSPLTLLQTKGVADSIALYPYSSIWE